MAEFASRGVAGSGLGLGIAGTALGLLNNNGTGILGGILGNGCNNGCNPMVNRYELSQSEIISKLQSEVALRDSNIFTDQKIANTYATLNNDIRDLTSKVNDIDKTLAVKCAQVEGTFAVLGERMNAMNNQFMCALNRERDERCCGDNTIVTYANATFYPKMVADVTVGTTSTAQTTYNPLYNCGCGCNK